MATITETMTKEAYRIGKDVFNQAMSLEDAISHLELDFGMNRVSANDYINDYRCYRSGQKYSRTMNEFSTDYYLMKIYSEEGLSVLVIALQAVEAHLDYYEALGAGKLPGARKILQKYKTIVDTSERVLYPENSESEYSEGNIRTVLVNIYERNPAARRKCIEHYGYRCSVCGIVPSDLYGHIGIDFIHVHHLKELSSIGRNYVVDPLEDLRPVCPNCHAMLHRKVPAFSIDELKELMEDQRNKMA